MNIDLTKEIESTIVNLIISNLTTDTKIKIIESLGHKVKRENKIKYILSLMEEREMQSYWIDRKCGRGRFWAERSDYSGPFNEILSVADDELDEFLEEVAHKEVLDLFFSTFNKTISL